MPTVSLIAALARNRVIGRDNKMPWHLPADLKHFKAVTMGSPVIMGRKTFESILASLGRPLPGRANIVISRNKEFSAPGCSVVSSLADALAACGDAKQAFVVGGGEIYLQALPLAQRMFLTEIDADVDGDAYFPDFDKAVWRETARESFAAAKGGLGYAFVTYEKQQDRRQDHPGKLVTGGDTA